VDLYLDNLRLKSELSSIDKKLMKVTGLGRVVQLFDSRMTAVNGITK
jgi:hypothetical protein